jgi:hypothetical protein
VLFGIDPEIDPAVTAVGAPASAPALMLLVRAVAVNDPLLATTVNAPLYGSAPTLEVEIGLVQVVVEIPEQFVIAVPAAFLTEYVTAVPPLVADADHAKTMFPPLIVAVAFVGADGLESTWALTAAPVPALVPAALTAFTSNVYVPPIATLAAASCAREITQGEAVQPVRTVPLLFEIV